MLVIRSASEEQPAPPRGHVLACDEINANNRSIARAPINLRIISFDKLYGDPGCMLSLYETLGVKIYDNLLRYVRRILANTADRLRAPRALDPAARKYAEQAVDWGVYEKLMRRAL